jgi:4-hydroxy-3-polyprenylbenzoate decarboxylase
MERAVGYDGRVKRVVVGLSGATGAIYGVRLLEELRREPDVEVHLVISGPGKRTLVEETERTVRQVEALAHCVYDDRDVGCALASGSFRTDGMAVVPCSMKTVSALASGYSETLIARAGDVALKERRPLVVVFRETPLHLGHLRQLAALAELGAVLLPPMPAFYLRPRTVAEIVDHTVARVLEHLGLRQRLVPEWTGTGVRGE